MRRRRVLPPWPLTIVDANLALTTHRTAWSNEEVQDLLLELRTAISYATGEDRLRNETLRNVRAAAMMLRDLLDRRAATPGYVTPEGEPTTGQLCRRIFKLVLPPDPNESSNP